MSDEFAYEDILHLPHHVSTRHPQMPLVERGAQFAPFAALTGFEEQLGEAEKEHRPEDNFLEEEDISGER